MLYGVQQWGVRQYGQQEIDSVPAIRNRLPAPGATQVDANSQVSFEVFQVGGGLDGEDIDIYLNQTLVWRGARIVGGIIGARTTLSDGFRFVFALPDPFEQGEQTIRVVVPSVVPLDESWSFDTAALVVTPEQVEAVINQDSGLDLKLDETIGDILVEGTDLALVAGVAEVAQHLRVGLALFRGDWYLDEQSGVPYYQQILISAPNTRAIETVFRQSILSDDDITGLPVFEMDIDRRGRQLAVRFVAESEIGDVAVDAVFP